GKPRAGRTPSASPCPTPFPGGSVPKSSGPSSDKLHLMSKLVAGCMLLAALLAPDLPAQVPGAYPHLQLTDGIGPLVPPASGPFDNSNEFQAFAGQSFQARISYA